MATACGQQPLKGQQPAALQLHQHHQQAGPQAVTSGPTRAAKPTGRRQPHPPNKPQVGCLVSCCPSCSLWMAAMPGGRTVPRRCSASAMAASDAPGLDVTQRIRYYKHVSEETTGLQQASLSVFAGEASHMPSTLAAGLQ